MSTANAGSEFWTERNEYHELAKQFERNVEVTHPSGASCFCGSNCPWAATTVTYYTYNGPSL